MSAVTVVSFDFVFVFERWLRHTGRLAQNTSVWQKIYSTCSIIAAIAGAAGLILLSIFDVAHHKHLHDGFLALFIGGYIVSAVFVCWEYQRLGVHYRQHRVLRMSFWVKLFFILQKIAGEQDVDVTEGELNSNIAGIAAQRGVRPEALKQQMQKEGSLQTLYVRLRERFDALRAADAGDIAVVVGGTIPESDVQKLLDAGAAAVFPTGTSLDTLVTDVRALTEGVAQ